MKELEKGVYIDYPIIGEASVFIYKIPQLNIEQVERYQLQKYYEFWKGKEKNGEPQG